MRCRNFKERSKWKKNKLTEFIGKAKAMTSLTVTTESVQCENTRFGQKNITVDLSFRHASPSWCIFILTAAVL